MTEMPSVSVIHLGLIYDIEILENTLVKITHTLTSAFVLWQMKSIKIFKKLVWLLVLRSALQIARFNRHLAWTWFPREPNLDGMAITTGGKVAEDKDKLQKMINKVVDLMIQDEAIREQISEILKEVKEFDIPMPTARKIAVTVRKQNLEDVQQDFDSFVELWKCAMTNNLVVVGTSWIERSYQVPFHGRVY